MFKIEMIKETINRKKIPRWIRIVRYNLNRIWYHILMPLRKGLDEFSKKIKSNNLFYNFNM